ncbi:hypothetical protein [Flavobacterium sp.]|uniref:hypothetical protein n=1 Tax=Flavobacterium sp. TaxID=239 RepID=UPI0039E4E2C3
MNKFEMLLASITDAKVIKETSGFPIDLSDSSPLLDQVSLTDTADFEGFIENYLTQNKADFAFGGYHEKRKLYQRSDIFNDGESDERNIHIGLDLWLEAGTPVLAALERNRPQF